MVVSGQLPRWWVELQERSGTIRLGPYETEERARHKFDIETIETYGYRGLAADSHTIEIRLVQEFEPDRELYGRRVIRDLVVRFCAACSNLGRDTCADASDEIAKRTAS